MWCWYPVQVTLGGQKRSLLVHGSIIGDEDISLSLVLDLEARDEDSSSLNLDNFEDASNVEDRAWSVATNKGHDDWVGFEALRSVAFPKANAF